MGNLIYIKDDEGNEVEMEIYFTFDANGKHYVLLHEKNNEEDFYPFTYDKDGNIQAVEDQDEFAMCLEVFNSFEGYEDEE